MRLMSGRAAARCLLAGVALAAIGFWRAVPVHGASGSAAATTHAWSGESAAGYLDARERWWQEWPRAQKDHGTVCISCHTNVPYAMARPGLRQKLGETGTSATEAAMLASVEKRVSQWPEMVPFYSDAVYGPGKTAESHATEAVLNAVMLASYDNQRGRLRAITRTAFDEAWALQEATGGWKWQDFHLGPWESTESAYQGATMLMIEAANAPGGYAKEPEARRHLDLLRAYLRRGYAGQPAINQLYVLWASAKELGLLTADERKALLASLRALEQPDGGWRTMAIDKRDRSDHSPEPAESDGYATGLAVLAMEEAGVSAKDESLKGGLAWLAAHQEKNGSWLAASINKKRDPESDASPFMTDAATAYAVMALEEQR